MSETRIFTTAPTADELTAVAEDAFEQIPRELVRHIQGVAIRVVDFPDEETVAEMELDSEFDLLGLYRGLSLDRRSVGDVRQDVDMIFLYRRPLLDYWCETGEDLTRLVRHVLIHEIGHHFGLSDEAMEAIEAAADEAAGDNVVAT
ncbi:MAG: metallopeptidase family protein [Alphaproteobacteria bacterium]|nr:metallopeptidase family protein [Alphaproteobacteria bacterium]